MSFRKMNPHIYWMNLLYSFFIVVVVLIGFSIYILFEIRNADIFQVTMNQAPEKLSLMNEKLFSKITKSFEVKDTMRLEIENGEVSYKDPSIN